jgi:hypothetical protein
MAPVIEVRVVELRRGPFHPGPGPAPASTRTRASRTGALVLGIYRALVRHHLIEPKNSRKRLPTYKRWERGRPNELWQMDIVGGVLLDDGIECKVLTGVDNHSRFCVCAGIMVRASARPVYGFFAQALDHHGVPEENPHLVVNLVLKFMSPPLLWSSPEENPLTMRMRPAGATTVVSRFNGPSNGASRCWNCLVNCHLVTP